MKNGHAELFKDSAVGLRSWPHEVVDTPYGHVVHTLEQTPGQSAAGKTANAGDQDSHAVVSIDRLVQAELISSKMCGKSFATLHDG